jgi:uncharacterized protein (TIGR00251 family)
VIELADHPEGVLLRVRAQPGARKAGLIGERDGALKLAVSAPPENSKANAALVELLRELLGVKRSQVELVRGQTVRDKQFLVRGTTRQLLAPRIAALFEHR